MKHRQLSIAVAAAVLLGSVVSPAAHASPTSPSKTSQPSSGEQDTVNAGPIGKDLEQKADKYVELSDGKYTVSPAAKEELSDEEYDAVVKTADSTNAAIEELGVSADTIAAGNVSSHEATPRVTARAAANDGGVTKVEFHWTGLRVYLSNSVLLQSEVGEVEKAAKTDGSETVPRFQALAKAFATITTSGFA